MPSVVSHHVRQLEQRLNTALLYRSTRKLSLTSEGERLLTSAHAMMKALIADGYDVALRAGIMEDSSLMTRKLFGVQRQLVAAPSYLATRAEHPVSPVDLSNWDWLLLAPVKRQKLVFHNGKHKETLTKLTSRMVVNNVHALCQLSKTGVGLTLIPAFIVEKAVNAGELSYVLPDWAVDPINVSAVWPSNAPKFGLVKHFINFIAEQNQPEALS